ncbi:hypothetical protein ACI2KR_30005 [Pseudomonas luteola]
MGLLAYRRDGTPVVSVFMSDSEWQTACLSKERNLYMPETGAEAVPKVSQLGYRFFSHKPGHSGEGGGGRESADHALLKIKALHAAKAAGWDALPEQSGETPAGKRFRVDVLCIRPNTSTKVAFEIQKSGQRDVDYEQRQAAYAEAGIRCLWIDISSKGYKGHLTSPCKDLPRFECWKKGRLGEYNYEVIVPDIYMKAVDFEDFIYGALTKQLRFKDIPMKYFCDSIMLHEESCHNCRELGIYPNLDRLYKITTNTPYRIFDINEKMQGYRTFCKIKPIEGLMSWTHLPHCYNCKLPVSPVMFKPNRNFGAIVYLSKNRTPFNKRYWAWKDDSNEPPEEPSSDTLYFISSKGLPDDTYQLEKYKFYHSHTIRDLLGIKS